LLPFLPHPSSFLTLPPLRPFLALLPYAPSFLFYAPSYLMPLLSFLTPLPFSLPKDEAGHPKDLDSIAAGSDAKAVWVCRKGPDDEKTGKENEEKVRVITNLASCSHHRAPGRKCLTRSFLTAILPTEISLRSECFVLRCPYCLNTLYWNILTG
jgi:hypothetical protein